MSAVHGKLRVGDLTQFPMYPDGHMERNSMPHSGWLQCNYAQILSAISVNLTVYLRYILYSLHRSLF